MAVNHEIKSHLAKLLATEDLVVEHKHVETAQFNVHTRVLTLPVWEKASGEVYDMLVGHEVGHALYTPDSDWILTRKISPQMVNIVEDVRIEKLMKRRYAGISKTFYRGYQELSDEDFFCLENENIPTMSLADRINLHFKIGNFVSIPFSAGEQHIVEMVAACETFDEVLDAAEALYTFCKQEMQNKKNEVPEGTQESSEGTQANVPNPGGDDGEGEPEDMQPDESYGGTAETDNTFDDDFSDLDGEPETKTVDSLADAIKDLANMDGYENVYIEVPKVDASKIIINNKTIHDSFCEWDDVPAEAFEPIDIEFVKFKKDARKEVNYLVKEFECRKSADSYARATTARTGVLDCTKLHTYKYNEDLFKKVTTLPDGKNHGLVFVLDWSGSMCDVMLDTIKQLYNLIWFCKKVSIPFEVYAFTNDYPIASSDEHGNPTLREPCYQKRDGVFAIPEYFSLLNLFTHKTNGKVLEQQMKNIFRLAMSFRRSYWTNFMPPIGLSLSGTPLNEALISLHTILPEFKKENGVQKVQCVVMTDGEANWVKYHAELQRRWEDEPFIGVRSVSPSCFLRDRKLGTTYSLDSEWYEFTDILLRNLKDRFTDVNFIGFRVLESRDAGAFIRRYCGYFGKEFESTMQDWKKKKAFTISNSGYAAYFGLSANALAQNSDFDVSDTATKTQIKSAFVKSLRSKKMNKKVLSEFVELVA
tara:strand:+ start:7193 stop:9301 length:2109 start_codon:yes stop_codon:yes gene_type:complete